jgi:hypothetical protein
MQQPEPTYIEFGEPYTDASNYFRSREPRVRMRHYGVGRRFEINKSAREALGISEPCRVNLYFNQEHNAVGIKKALQGQYFLSIHEGSAHIACAKFVNKHNIQEGVYPATIQGDMLIVHLSGEAQNATT